MKRFIHRLSSFINHNTGWLIAAAIVFFGLTNVAFLKDNTRILRDTRATVKNTETIIQNLETAVEDLKADNGQQTVILCKLILSGRFEVTAEEATQIEKVCSDRIAESISEIEDANRGVINRFSAPTEPTEQVILNSQDQIPSSPAEESTEPERPLPTLINGVQNGINGIIDGVKGLFN